MEEEATCEKQGMMLTLLTGPSTMTTISFNGIQVLLPGVELCTVLESESKKHGHVHYLSKQ